MNYKINSLLLVKSKKKIYITDLTMVSQSVVKICQVTEVVEGVNGIQVNNMTIDKLTVKTFSKKYILNSTL